ncbi:MAG: hypothetical protein BWY63_00432 [Chloroflexi bacterium ADurb.Bin360]|nr:MAG: hypothetical protein BWY63_00432 [Chloroflexi bacterium ADurb.Bin360]
MNNERGEGFLEVFVAIGAAAFFLIAIGIPVADAYRLQAQADADIAAANLTMAQGLSTVATANAMTPVLLSLASVAVALAIIALCVVAIVYLRRRYPRQWRAIEAPPAPPVVLGKRQPALTEEPAAAWLPTSLRRREAQWLEVRR